MNKKILTTFLLALTLVACTYDNSNNNIKTNNNETYEDIEKEEIKEDIIIDIKEIYSCDDKDFFYIEHDTNLNLVNFIYGNYSIPLFKKPYNNSLYSDGLYTLNIENDIANVMLDKDLILSNCKKIK